MKRRLLLAVWIIVLQVFVNLGSANAIYMSGCDAWTYSSGDNVDTEVWDEIYAYASYSPDTETKAEAEAQADGWNLGVRSWAMSDKTNLYSAGASAYFEQEFEIIGDSPSLTFSYSGDLQVTINGSYPTENDYPWYDDWGASVEIEAYDYVGTEEGQGNSYFQQYEFFDEPDSQHYEDTFVFTYDDMIAEGLVSTGDIINITVSLLSDTSAYDLYLANKVELNADFYHTLSLVGVSDMQPVDPPGSAAPVPEPATLFLVGIGLVGIAGIREKVFR
ncbi:MAG: hypothetical protein DRP47_12135 [Candidatus Zixiibacteriota bacterium]|nr:MAG: hypothetical protein DRP47_12135 [candidate division Zixibacteria bacterium]